MDLLKTTPKKYLVFILGLLSAVGPFSIDMYLPSFPAIAADLHTSVEKVSLSLSSFFIGVSVGQLVYGPLLDRFGRKKPLCIGLLIYVIASLGCVFASSVEMLIGLRLLQALGGCAGMVAARAIVRDLFSAQDIAKTFSTLMLVIGISPIVAPISGSWVTTTFGWHYIFLLLSVLSFLLLIVVIFFLPESRESDSSISLNINSISKEFWSVMRDSQFFTYAVSGSLAAASLYIYLAGSPFLFMEYFKVTETQYGWIFALIAMGLIGATQLNRLVLKKLKSEQIIKIALYCEITVGILLFGGTLLGIWQLFGTLILILLFFWFQGFIFPNTSALSLMPFTKNAGSASALLGFIQMCIGAIASALVNIFHTNSALPMTGLMLGFALTSFIVLVIGKRTSNLVNTPVAQT